MPINIGDTRAKKVYLGDTLIYQELPKSTAVYYRNSISDPWTAVTVSWSTDHFECSPSTMPGFQVAVTDGNEPDAQLSNVHAYFVWTSGTSFGIVAIVPFYDGTHGDAPIHITL